MKALALHCILVLFVWSVVLAQPNPDTLWTRSFRDGHRAWAYDIQLTNDGSYIIAGHVEMGDNVLIQGYLVKMDSLGSVIWSHNYGGSSFDEFNSVQPTTDGGYIAGGCTQSFGYPDGADNFYLVKTNSVGDTLWTRTYGGSSIDRVNCIRQTDDGGYVFTGYSSSSGVISPNCVLFKTDSNGDSLWAHYYGNAFSEIGNSVEQTSDGGYIIAGYLVNDQDGDGWLIKTDAEGDTVWTHQYGGAYSDEFQSVQETADGGFLCGGSTYSYGQSWDSDGYMVKTNSVGDTLWTLACDNTEWDYLYSAHQTEGGYYVATGFTGYEGPTGTDVWLIKADERGDLMWSRTYNSALVADYAWAMQQTSDGGYILAGCNGGNLEEGAPFCYIVKTGPDEISAVPSPPNRETPDSFILYSPYPNPFNSFALISYQVPSSGYLRLNIYNLLGQVVGTPVNRWHSAGRHSVVWNAGDLPSGIYFCRVNSGDFSQTRKVVLIR